MTRFARSRCRAQEIGAGFVQRHAGQNQERGDHHLVHEVFGQPDEATDLRSGFVACGAAGAVESWSPVFATGHPHTAWLHPTGHIFPSLLDGLTCYRGFA
jgi:hypothetical protein